MAAHGKSGKRNRFCCSPAKPCKCESPNNYRKNCVVGWSYQAHHVLCKASVKTCIAKKRGLSLIVKETRWCVNAKGNMIALPLWGHTVKWYYKNDKSPPFRNLPQHDWDHNGSGSYREEVESSLDDLAAEVASAKKKHDKERVKNLKGGLVSRSQSFKRKLRACGKRQGGTHRQFTTEGSNARWHEPFSMAQSATEKGYPKQYWKSAVRDKVSRFFA